MELFSRQEYFGSHQLRLFKQLIELNIKNKWRPFTWFVSEEELKIFSFWLKLKLKADICNYYGFLVRWVKHDVLILLNTIRKIQKQTCRFSLALTKDSLTHRSLWTGWGLGNNWQHGKAFPPQLPPPLLLPKLEFVPFAQLHRNPLQQEVHAGLSPPVKTVRKEG